MESRLNDGTIIYTGDCGQERDVVILESRCKLKIRGENSALAQIGLKVKRNELQSVQDNMIVNALSGRELERIAQSVRGQVLACFEKCQKADIDIFHLGELFYRRQGEAWRRTQNKLYIRDIDFDVQVQVTVK